MIRILLFVLIAIASYYLLKRLFSATGKTARPGPGRYRPAAKPPPIQDELVKDPVCGVYCPKREALPLVFRGKAHYFCSEKCRQRFLERERKKEGDAG